MYAEEAHKSYFKGELLGLKSVLLDTTRINSYIAKSACICYSISVESLNKVIGMNFRGIVYMIAIKEAFRNSVLLSKFEDFLIDKTYPAYSIKYYDNNDVVVKKGHPMNTNIYIVIEGGLKKVFFYFIRMIKYLQRREIFFLRMKFIRIQV